jgi:hypothetical protein
MPMFGAHYKVYNFNIFMRIYGLISSTNFQTTLAYIACIFNTHTEWSLSACFLDLT